MRLASWFGSVTWSLALLLVGYGLVRHLNVPIAGSFGDWAVGLLAAFWLVAVVTVPWNVHFKAKAVLADAGPSRDRGLAVDPRQVAYVARLARVSLWVAVALHVASAAVLLGLAVAGVSRVGYAGSVVALLLTGLRPAAAAYHYLAERLRTIGHDWHYPREDVVEVRRRLDAAEAELASIKLQLDPDRPESLAAVQRDHVARTRDEIAAVAAAVAAARAANDADHDRLSREAKSAISQLSVDGQFLDHVREIIRFFKSA